MLKKYFTQIGGLIALLTTACQPIQSVQLSADEPAVVIPSIDFGANLFANEIRSYDGSGNNVTNPQWGSAGTNLIRISPADYSDGLSSPSGSTRPSARIISNTFAVSPEEGVFNDRDFTAMVYAWGQFLDHDIDLTVGAEPKEAFHVIVPTGDPEFDPTGTGAMIIPLSRSNYDPNTGTTNPREQINSISAFIDGSQVYGSDPERAAALREFEGGRLKISDGNLPPFNTQGYENANDAHRFSDEELFLAGDVRANENPELLSLHTLFIREHNRIAARAAERHPDWTDEELYQFARTIVIAELQKITYEEFLPSLLGPRAIPEYRGYDATINPGIANEFSTAAFRFGHSMLGDDIEFLNNEGEENFEAMALRDSFFNPEVIQETDIDPILKYLASDNAQEIDTIAVDDVRNFLFGQPGQGGFDLASLNIQRGRDHGLADYNSVRIAYGLPRVESFEQITSNKALEASLASTYGNVDNIDLWIGGLAEDHLPNSSMGETFTAILVDQFTRLRDGDRFWYQNVLDGNALENVEDSTLADVIRRNTELTKLQEDVFFFNEENTVVINRTETDGQNQSGGNGDNESNDQGNQPPPPLDRRGPRGNGGRGGGRPPRP